MDKLEEKNQQLLQALDSLNISIRAYKNLLKKENQDLENLAEISRIYRDSVIQRFEYCSELFWKYLKRYLEHVSVPVEIIAPVPVIRSAYAAGILNDQEGEGALEMIKDRNKTSHIYKEEIAELLAQKIPQHYELMISVAKRLVP